ncbi:hypothetical protein GOBAR_AA35199 [Gossypium barbadense]|uniref:Uncharacterized protein n=1 Tax=Gossypium barbadense TaxID=3634 RepID=A0A2P5W334_GOSBA|nr:hypothetical protein GOBAR_AA35199 [Gossypium barbadense]
MRTSPSMHLSDCRNREALINDDVKIEKGKTSSAAVIVAIFQQLMTEVVVKGLEVQNCIGKFPQLERSRDPSVVTGATILASLSSLRPYLSH